MTEADAGEGPHGVVLLVLMLVSRVQVPIADLLNPSAEALPVVEVVVQGARTRQYAWDWGAKRFVLQRSAGFRGPVTSFSHAACAADIASDDPVLLFARGISCSTWDDPHGRLTSLGRLAYLWFTGSVVGVFCDGH